ncbi:hypothetical protein [Enterobacter roggenkampii]|uniref:hypothetical protein n=1 Tax=Enterobacter roggenkampii TaxID=1812935 RepID=UPI0024099C4A|nr:hypothetical protein [Enterobacter roggenkampii]WFC89302.1 hypothetical protein OM420_12100 [Enterobacter roggenkampii]
MKKLSKVQRQEPKQAQLVELNLSEIEQVSGGVPYRDGRDYGSLSYGAATGALTSIWLYSLRYNIR